VHEEKKKKSMLGVAASVLFGIIILVIIFTIYPFEDVITTFQGIKLEYVFSFLIVSIAIMVFLTLRWKFILHSLGYKNFKFTDLFSYRVIDYGVSYITPSAKLGGEAVRAALMMRQGVSFKEGLSTIVLDKTIELSVILSFFVLGAILLVFEHTISGVFGFILLAIAALLLYLVVSFYLRVLKGKPVFGHLFRKFRMHKSSWLSKYEHKVAEFEKPILAFYQHNRKDFFIAVGITLVTLVLSMIEYKLILAMVGVDLKLSMVFLVFSLVGASFLIPVPMALGSLEASQAYLFSLIGIKSAAGIGVAIITRARDLIWVLIALGIGFYLGSLRNIIREAFTSNYNTPFIDVKIGKRKAGHLKIRVVDKKEEKEDFEMLKQKHFNSKSFWKKTYGKK
jgi:uncharacterized protein (TIRG00374 family)